MDVPDPFGAQLAIAIAHSARPRGRDQAHRVDTGPPRAHHSRAAREPRVPRTPHAPGPRRRCPRHLASRQPAARRGATTSPPSPQTPPGRERPIAITSRCPPTFTTSTTLSTPDTSTTRPSHTAPTAGPNADAVPPQHPRRAAPRDKQPSHQTRPAPHPAAADPSPSQTRRETTSGRCGARGHRFFAEGVIRQADQLTIANVANR